VHQKKVTAIIIIFSISLFFLIGLLFFEYRSLVHHTERLQELKHEYRMHVFEIKRILTDYHQTKERLSQFESVLESDEPLKIVAFEDDGCGEFQEPLVAINRDLEYLKQQSQEYIKNQNLELLFRHVPEDIWLDYTDVALIEKKPKSVRPKKPTAKKQFVRSVSPSTKKGRGVDLLNVQIFG